MTTNTKSYLKSVYYVNVSLSIQQKHVSFPTYFSKGIDQRGDNKSFSA